MLSQKIPASVIRIVDESLRLKEQIKLLETQLEEKKDIIRTYMCEHQLDRIETKLTQVDFSNREVMKIDPDAYWDAVDGSRDKIVSVITVRKDPNKKTGEAGARSYLGEEDLDSICTPSDIPVLRISSVKPTSMTNNILGSLPKARKGLTV